MTITGRPISRNGTPLTFEEADTIRDLVSAGKVPRHAIAYDFAISLETLRAVVSRRGRYAVQSAAPSRAATVASAVTSCRSACGALIQRHHAAREMALREIAALEAEHLRALESEVRAACRVHHSPFSETYAAVLGAFGRGDPRRSLTPPQVAAIRKALEDGVSGNTLANQYGVSPMVISRIRNHKSYRNAK